MGLFVFGLVFYSCRDGELSFDFFFKFLLAGKQLLPFFLGIQTADLSLAFPLLPPFSCLANLFGQCLQPRLCSLPALKFALPYGDDRVTGINKYSEIGIVSAVKMESGIQ